MMRFLLSLLALIFVIAPIHQASADPGCVQFPDETIGSKSYIPTMLLEALGTTEIPFGFAFVGNPQRCAQNTCFLHFSKVLLEIEGPFEICKSQSSHDPEPPAGQFEAPEVSIPNQCRLEISQQGLGFRSAIARTRIVRQTLRRCGDRLDAIFDFDFDEPDRRPARSKEIFLVTTIGDTERWELHVNFK